MYWINNSFGTVYGQGTTGRSSHPVVFLGLFLKTSRMSVLRISNKFTGEHPCQSVISIKLLCKLIETTLQHWCSPVLLCCIFSEQLYLRTPLDGCFWTGHFQTYQQHALVVKSLMDNIRHRWHRWLYHH